MSELGERMERENIRISRNPSDQHLVRKNRFKNSSTASNQPFTYLTSPIPHGN